jgi:hypothetical protein
MCGHTLAVADFVVLLEPYLLWHRRNVGHSMSRILDASSCRRRRGTKAGTPRRKQPPKKFR